MGERVARIGMEVANRRGGRMNHSLQSDRNKLSSDMVLNKGLTREGSKVDLVARRYLLSIYEIITQGRGTSIKKVTSTFPSHVRKLVEDGIYDSILAIYSQKELEEFAKIIELERDNFFTFREVKTLAEQYLTRNKDGSLIELPQERWLVMAMTLMANEPADRRLELVKESYWALSHLYMTVSGFLAHAGKTDGQLPNSFVNIVADDLRSVYESCTDIATIRKYGGDLSIYLGKIRAIGSMVDGKSGISSGVIPLMEQLSNIVRYIEPRHGCKGTITVFLDVWHKDIFSFLEVSHFRLSKFLVRAVSLPDLFMEAVENHDIWYLFDPNEVREKLGFSLEDSYDEEKGFGTFRKRYKQCIEEESLSRVEVSALELMKKIISLQLQLGSPFMFYRDTVNRLNPNHHQGIIYCSNGSTEIMQNLSTSELIEEKSENGKVITTKRSGDFVASNHSSLSLVRAGSDQLLKRLIPIQVRMLDNAICLNLNKVKQAELTNEKYRAIGVGTTGWQQMLVRMGMNPECDEANAYMNELDETINYLVIEASMKLAKEKGAYPSFAKSDWETGEYFKKRQYTSKKWVELQQKVKTYGVRNGYMLAVSPPVDSTTTPGARSTKNMFDEMIKHQSTISQADLLSEEERECLIDSQRHIRLHGKRQRHIDQGISASLYISNHQPIKKLLSLHLLVWKEGLKATYYVWS